ncbi:MAG: hypothetical protein E3J86_12270 [Candidatus Thorarchaeota archaeon]|nr:MAG: hypothetical protein E3J86_12270 [Candidatus Thorarchaeota archaeon]
MQMPGPWDFPPMFVSMIFIVPIAIIMLVIVVLKLFRASKKIVGGFITEPPSFVIPERERGQERSDRTEVRTVRLPNKCISCGAPLSHSDIDWVGPLEAKCTYCSATVKAQFERV